MRNDLYCALTISCHKFLILLSLYLTISYLVSLMFMLFTG